MPKLYYFFCLALFLHNSILNGASVLDLKHFQLKPAGANFRQLADQLGRALAAQASVIDVMNNLNRPGGVNGRGKFAIGDACNRAAIEAQARPVVQYSICFQDDDENTKDWYPQGVSTVGDASADGYWKSPRYSPILLSWYDNQQQLGLKGVRLSFVDANEGKYRHVLLVYPKTENGKITYDILRASQNPNSTDDFNTSLHAGGILWYGNHVFVADTDNGFRMFDVRRIFDLEKSSKGATDKPNQFGLIGGKYYAYGYRYIMPQVGAWVRTAPTGKTCSDTRDEAPHFSYVSLDRSGTDTLVAGEYCDDLSELPNPQPGEKKSKGRVAVWKIAQAFRNNELITDTAYRWNAISAYSLPEPNIQGATRFEGKWYLSKSTIYLGSSETRAGRLIITEKVPAGTTSGTLKVSTSQPISIGPEDLSHSPVGTPTKPKRGWFWTVSEHAGQRMLYATVPGER